VRQGTWHQFGHNSQRMAIEQIENDCGVGVILSPRDLAFDNANQYAERYHDLGAHVLIDPQFYRPEFSNSNLESYPLNASRAELTSTLQLSARTFDAVVAEIRETNHRVNAEAIIAPALAYRAARNDIVECNRRLFEATSEAADSLNVPVYATVILTRSVTSSDQVVSQILARATSLNPDGWYFGFEFEGERIPSSYELVLRCCLTGLKLAKTGKPVLHAYAGPMALLSQGFGARAAGIGHSQNLWNFTHGRWSTSPGQGGGGDAPARFFSKSLWGTIVYPDEIVQLSNTLQNQIFTPTIYSPGQITRPLTPLSRWNAGKHFVSIVGEEVQRIAQETTFRNRLEAARVTLANAVTTLGQIGATGLVLRDEAASYQNNWLRVVQELQNNKSSEYDYLDLIS